MSFVNKAPLKCHTELLDRLLPWTVQQAAMRCKEQGVATKQKEIAKLKEASRNLNSLVSL